MIDDGLRAVAQLTDSLSRATTLDQIYDHALESLRTGLLVDRASILLFDQQQVMNFVAWRGISDEYRAAVNGHTPWRPDSRDVTPICIADVRADASLADYLPTFERERIRALGFFPLTYRDSVIGKFMLYYPEPHELTAPEIQLAQTIAGQIAFGVARIQAEESLRRERNRLDAVVTNAPGVVWETVEADDGTVRVTFVSHQIETLLGYTRQEWYTTPQLGSQLILEDLLISTGSPEIHHYRMRRRDGGEIWTEVRLARSKEPGRVVTRGVTIDITAQKEAARRDLLLGEASRLLASSLDYAATLPQVAQLMVCDLADWCAIDLKTDEGEAERFLVLHREGREAAVSRIRAHKPAMQKTMFVRNVIETGEPLLLSHAFISAFEHTYRDEPDLLDALRELGLSSFMIVPVIAGGRTFGAISLVSGTRHFNESHLELACELGRRVGYAVDHALLFREAQEANRAKDEFLVTLSHELRTPMTATLGWATMLRRDDVSPENFRIAVETIDRSTRAQASLIDDILDVSRIVSGKLQLAIAPADLGAILSAAVDAIRPSALAKEIELNLVGEDTPVTVMADLSRMQQVLWNLLSNAVKFTGQGGKVAVTLHPPADSRVKVTVEDDGVGIPARFLPHVFERFRQADSSTSRKHGGLGLGLAIVQSLMELHGGSVTAESEGPGHGARFTITLPLAKEMAEQAAVAAAATLAHPLVSSVE